MNEKWIIKNRPQLGLNKKGPNIVKMHHYLRAGRSLLAGPHVDIFKFLKNQKLCKKND